MEEKGRVHIEELLSQGKVIQLYPRGYSMYPMFVPGRDQAIIAPVGEKTLKKGDVVLYRRDNSILVLHRICKAAKEGFYLVGDNQVLVEGPLRPDQIKGILIGFIRKGRKISVKNPVYFISSRLWLLLRPWRNPIKKLLSNLKKFLIKKIFKRKKK